MINPFVMNKMECAKYLPVCEGFMCVVMMRCAYIPLTSLEEDVILLGPLGDRPQKCYGRLLLIR